jgi:hypothetical protein
MKKVQECNKRWATTEGDAEAVARGPREPVLVYMKISEKAWKLSVGP